MSPTGDTSPEGVSLYISSMYHPPPKDKYLGGSIQTCPRGGCSALLENTNLSAATHTQVSLAPFYPGETVTRPHHLSRATGLAGSRRLTPRLCGFQPHMQDTCGRNGILGATILVAHAAVARRQTRVANREQAPCEHTTDRRTAPRKSSAARVVQQQDSKQ